MSDALITADVVKKLIAAKHAEDVYVGECKDGSTWFSEHLRLDGWALLRTWSPPTSIGYEVKVSRSDWLNDRKFMAYKSLCHQLYVVAPDGVVKDGELPEEVGYIRVSQNAMRLITKKKAPYRAIDWPGDLMAYILMSRATIDCNCKRRNLDEWRAWAEDRADQRMLGFLASKTMAKRFAEQVGAVRSENSRLKSEAEQVNRIIAAVKSRLGIDLCDCWGRSEEHLAEQFLDQAKVFSIQRVQNIRRLAQDLGKLVQDIDEVLERSKSLAKLASGGAA